MRARIKDNARTTVIKCMKAKKKYINLCLFSLLVLVLFSLEYVNLFNYLGRCCPFYNDKLGRVMEDFNKPCKECPFQYTSDQYVFSKGFKIYILI